MFPYILSEFPFLQLMHLALILLLYISWKSSSVFSMTLSSHFTFSELNEPGPPQSLLIGHVLQHPSCVSDLECSITVVRGAVISP